MPFILKYGIISSLLTSLCIPNILSFISFAPVLLIIHCIFIFTFKRWLGPIGTFYGSIFTYSVTLLISSNDLYNILLTGSYYYVDFGRWFFCLDIVDSQLVFCADTLSVLSSLLVLLLTMFALYFGVEYMYREAFINRLLYLLNLFATSVVFLFYSYDFFLILFAWECIGLFSFLLVNFYSTRIYTIKAAVKTFVFSRISDMFMFYSFIMSVTVFNTTELSLLFTQTPFFIFHYIYVGDYALHFLTLITCTLALSGSIKAAQFFFHVWLPDAMEAPTPASALIHSSTLVVAGIFLIIRFSVLFEFALFTNYLLIVLGALTLSFGAITATFQNDIKKLVAYSTISQIGYLTCGCGFCCYEEVLVYLIVHALNKAFLFVLVGYTVHFFSGNTDMRQMGGSYLYSFDITAMLFFITINLAGLPYTAGFIAKEFLLFQVLRDDFISLFVRGTWLVSFLFTPIYMLILIFIVQFGVKKGTISVYRSNWEHNVSYYWALVQLTQHNYTKLSSVLSINSVFTSITSRLTSYLLISFWVFIIFYGESLYLILFNYSTITDSINSTSFTLVKQHYTFMLTSNSTKLTNVINYYILLTFLSSLCFLINLNLLSSYLVTHKLTLLHLFTLFTILINYNLF